MPKNRVFRRRYIIEFKGISTNDFMPQFLDRTLDRLVDHLAGRFKQLHITKYITEDPRSAAASELTPGGVQINLLYKSPASRRSAHVKPEVIEAKGSKEGSRRPQGRPGKPQQFQTESGPSRPRRQAQRVR